MTLLNSSPYSLLHRTLRHVPLDRLGKGAEGLAAGTYTVTLTTQDETEIAGFVTNGDGLRYGVVLTEARAFCSCPDSMFRHTLCKHSVILSLYVLRMPEAEAKEVELRIAAQTPEEEQPVNLKLGKVRKDFQACA